MDAVIIKHLAPAYDFASWSKTMEPFWTKDFVYDSTKGTGVATGMHDWFYGEHTKWNDAFSPVTFTQLIFAGEEYTATTTTYATVQWRGPFEKVPASHSVVRVRVCDFYKMTRVPAGELRIAHNWMMLDVAVLLRASGRRVLPPAAGLPDEGLFHPPRAMSGVPAPLSAFTPPAAREASRAVALELLASDWGLQGGDSVRRASRDLWHPDMNFYGPAGVGMAQGFDQYATHVLAPLNAAFPDRRFELDVVACEGSFGGKTCM